MISDWTIYGVYVPEEGVICLACFRPGADETWSEICKRLEAKAEPAERDDFATFLDEHGPDLGTLRSLWMRDGLDLWLSDLVDRAFSDDFPVQPMISVELDQFLGDDACDACGGDGSIAELDADGDIVGVPCPHCEDGTLPARCDRCGEEY